MDKEKRRHSSLGNKPCRLKFHPWRLRSYRQLESLGQQTLLPGVERELPRVLYSRWRPLTVSNDTQRNLQHRCAVRREVGYSQQRGLLCSIGDLQLQLHRHVK